MQLDSRQVNAEMRLILISHRNLLVNPHKRVSFADPFTTKNENIGSRACVAVIFRIKILTFWRNIITYNF